MAHQFLNPAVAAAHMMQQAQGAGGGRFPVTGHPHPNPAQAGKYRTCVSGIAVGTRLRVTLPCNCQYNLTVPNPRAYLVFMPTGARHEGKQVFRFGGVPLFFDPDKGLIFAKLDTQGFKPASIQKLLEKAA